ncbi:hypothetical protein Tco_1153227 [Tanacetum coccineum]
MQTDMRNHPEWTYNHHDVPLILHFHNPTVMPAPMKKLDSEFNDEKTSSEMADTQAETPQKAPVMLVIQVLESRRCNVTTARGEGHLKETRRGLDAEAEAFLADVECTAPYDQPQALTTTNMFQANHEDAYDSDVDEGPNAAVAFMANLSSTSATNNSVNEKHLDSDAETEIDDNTIPYHQYLLDIEAQNVPTEVSADTSDKVSMIAILTDLQTQLDGHAKAYWLPANERASQTSNQTSPVTPFVHKCRPPSQVLASLQQVNAAFHQFEDIIKERTTQKPDYVSEWCYDYAKQFVEQQLVPFYDHFKKHIQAANDIFFKEIREFEQIFDELEAEKRYQLYVLSSDIVVPPSFELRFGEDLRSAAIREHTRVLELEC